MKQFLLFGFIFATIQLATAQGNTNAQNDLFPEHESQLNIPFTHNSYTELDYFFNKADNSHTAAKPYAFMDAARYVDLSALKSKLLKNKSSFIGRKIWNEHFFSVQKEDYWFTIDPAFDLQLGKDNSDDVSFTYNNTRALKIQGGLGKNFNFSTTFYESQGRFADYINKSARANPPIGAGAIIPGRGKGKNLPEGGFDYPVAEAYLSYTPNKFFNFQFGHGKNFIGDGYRSFMLSDVASPNTFFKINTEFWKIKYTNIWMWLDDVRPSVGIDGNNFRKYVAIHHLSWNVNERLNLGLFEAVVSANTGNGFDVSFFNPVIFYRAVEFTKGSEGGNAMIGLNGKYKLTDNITAYSQFVLDELTVGRFFDGDGYWGNKFAFQIGAKYFDAFKIDNLYLQGELNITRPYTFSHFGNGTLNYGHFNQPLGHLWGSNFWETVGIARYKKGRWFANAKIVLGEKGFDQDGLNYGGDIYRSNDERIADTGIEIGQGNKTSIFIGDIQAGYVVNPATNLQFFGGLTVRNFDPTTQTSTFAKQNTTWVTVGLRTDLFNWYFDF